MDGSVIAAMILGVLLVIVGFAHPIGPGLMIAAETPFDVIPFVLFGVVGNIITYVPVLIFLIRVNPALWGTVFFGTRVQQYFALFILLLFVSHAQGIVERGLDEIFEWLRKLTLFTLLGILTYIISQTKHLPLLVKTIAGSMAVYTVLSMLDFYLGVQLLPVKAGRLEGAILELEYQSHLATGWRFTGAGYPINRFSNYLLLPAFLGIGWFRTTSSTVQRTLALGCTSILIIGILLSITRSSILGLAVGTLILLPMAFRLAPQQILGVLLVGGVLGGVAWYGVSLTASDEVLAMRFDTGMVAAATGGRIDRIVAAFKIWAQNPIFGVGWNHFVLYSGEYVAVGGKSAHNGYLRVLAEAGLIGFVPMMIATVAVVRRGLRSVGRVSTELEAWRPYFFCALVAQFVTNVFNDYFWERYLWATFAFMAALEHCYHQARAPHAPVVDEAPEAGLDQPAPFRV